MSRKALKVVVDVNFRGVSCPGVHLSAKDDIYLSVCFMGQCRQSECLPAIFPLLVHEKMTFEKIFRHAVDPGDVAVMLTYETVRIELVQLVPPVGDTLACFEEDARHFLFPEPKLVPSFSGVDREVLMTRAPHFPGIAPRLEFSTSTTIIECSADAEVNIYPSVHVRPVAKKNRKYSSRPRTSSPQRKSPNFGRRRARRVCREHRHSSRRSPTSIPRSQSFSPRRAGNARGLAQLDPASTSQPMVALWRGARRSVSPHRSSPLTRTSSGVRYSSTGRQKPISTGLIKGMTDDDSSSSESHDPLDDDPCPDHSTLLQPYWEQTRQNRSRSSSDREWEEVYERVRGLLTTPKAVRRLVSGATHYEIEDVLARRSISPGPPS